VTQRANNDGRPRRPLPPTWWQGSTYPTCEHVTGNGDPFRTFEHIFDGNADAHTATGAARAVSVSSADRVAGAGPAPCDLGLQEVIEDELTAADQRRDASRAETGADYRILSMRARASLRRPPLISTDSTASA